MDTGKYETFDQDTGEIIDQPEREAPQEPAQEQPRGRYETATGTEIIPPGHDRAADGQIMRTEAHTAGNFLDMLEDGNFSHEVHRQLKDVAARMASITNATGNKTKGKVTLVIDLEKEGEHLSIRGKVTAKAPELPRPKTIVWDDENTGRFTRFPPQQTQMFGMRPVRNAG
jgi:hypothetical protein